MYKWLSILFLITVCSIVNQDSQLELSNPAPPSEASKTVTSRAQPLVSSMVYHHWFMWDYPVAMPADNIAFDLQGSTNLYDWYWIQTTNQPPVPYDSYQPYEFYRVGAHWIVDPN